MTEQSTTAPKRFSFDIAAAWVLAVTACAALIAFVPGNAVSLLGTKVALLFLGAIIVFIIFVIARLVKGSMVLPPLALLGVLWLIPIAYALSTLFSGTNPSHAFFGAEFETDTFGFVVLLAVLATLSALVLRRARDFLHLFSALGIGIGVMLGIQVLFVLLARISPGFVSPADNVIGAFSDVGMLAGLGIVLALIAMRFFSFSPFRRAVLWVGVVVALLILALVNSPLHFILVGLVSLGLFIEGMMRRRPVSEDTDLQNVATLSSETDSSEGVTSPTLLIAPLIVLLVSIFLLIGGSVVGNALADMTGVNVIDVRPSWRSTFDVGSHTYASSPLFGSGPGTFSEQWLTFRDRSLNDTIFWNIDFASGIGHIPTSFVTTGAIGVIAWLAFLGFFLFVGIRTFLFRLPRETFVRFASLASFTGALYVFGLAFFAAPGPVVLGVGFILFGLFVSSLRYGKDRPEWGIIFSKSPRTGFIVVFGLTLLLLASVAASYVVVERYMASATYGSAFRALSEGNAETAGIEITRSLSFASTDRSYRLAAAIGIERMRAIAADTTLQPTVAQQQFQGALSASVAAGLEATRIGPKNYQNWVVLGNVYQSVASLGIAGAYESAKTAYERAVALNPSSPVIPYIIAQLEIAQGNVVAAEERLLASVSQKRDYIPAILLLSQLKVQTGDAREALEAAEAAAYLAPNDPAVLLSVGLLRLGIGDTPGAIAALTRAVEINTQYANARFFLAAIHANAGRFPEALVELRAVAAMSPENAASVATDITALEAGKNPFPLTRLRSLGIPQPPVNEPVPAQ